MNDELIEFDELDCEIAEAMKLKGWIISTDGRELPADFAPPLPRGLLDTKKAVSRILAGASASPRTEIVQFPGSSDMQTEIARAARDGKKLTRETEEKLRIIRQQIQQNRETKE